MRASPIFLLLLFADLLCGTLAVGQGQQFVVKDINSNLSSDSNAPTNCTDKALSWGPPGWEFNCDMGSGNCSSNSTAVCAYTPPTLVSHTGNGCGTTPDGQAREFDVSWPGDVNGGSIFHANLTLNDSRGYNAWSWGGWFCYTNMSQIWRVELDLNQIMSDDNVLFLSAQCDMSSGYWQFGDDWQLGNSNIACPTVAAGNWPVNTWVHIVVSATRCATYEDNEPCPVTYNSVYFYPPIDGNPALQKCTLNATYCNSADGRVQENNWDPLGGLIENVQLDMDPSSANSMTAYGDLMTTNSPQSTQVATPTFSPGGGDYNTYPPPSVTITSTSGAAICYTLDGTTPTANGGGTCTHGSTYTNGSPVPITKSETLKAIGSEDGFDFDSAVESAYYFIGP